MTLSIVDARPKEVPPAKVPDFVTFNPHLKGVRGAVAVRLYAVLDRHVNGKSRVCYPGWRILIKAMKCNADGINRAIKDLEGIRALQVKRSAKGPKGKGVNIYYLLEVPNRVPAEWKGHKPKKGEGPEQLNLGEVQPCTPPRINPAPTGGAERFTSNATLKPPLTLTGSKGIKAEINKLNRRIEDNYATLRKGRLSEIDYAQVKLQIRRDEERIAELREGEE